MLIKQIKTAFSLLILLTLLTGFIYPGIITGLAQILFPWQSNGSFFYREGKPLGSLLIGQSFTDPKYFWGRPSATKFFPYNAEYSGGSNHAVMSSTFLDTVKNREMSLKKADLDRQGFIPIDLLTASASGLDPEISPEAAFYQVHRIAKIRKIPEYDIEVLIQNLINNRTLGILGEPRVNVLLLNLALDALLF